MQIRSVVAVMLLLLFSSSTFATDSSQYNTPADHLALEGYDPVSYFDGSPVKGDEKLSLKVDGITYRFASEQHRDAFKAEPAKYKPAYGGWCATAMAKGEKVEVDPKNFKITNGRLFLFYNGFWGNAKKDWDKDESALTRKADDAWKKTAGE